MSSPGFNAGGNGSSEYFSGRSTNTINNLTTTNNLHHNLSLYRTQQQPLPPIFLDPSSQIPQQRFIGKRTLA
ncbi:scarecrow-like protein 8-like, partial [Trifolium medium]|nr:scarecrow-like protein 8-like [Trifolium medium]